MMGRVNWVGGAMRCDGVGWGGMRGWRTRVVWVHPQQLLKLVLTRASIAMVVALTCSGASHGHMPQIHAAAGRRSCAATK